LRASAWNALEHGLTRLLDAASTLLLLWFLSPEMFAKLAVAQAVAAPLLLVFVSPETILYKEYARWRAEGDAPFAWRVRILRRFGWAKAAVVLPLAAAVAAVGGAGFWAIVWAFFLFLAPQIAGTDRELLRLGLRLRALNLLTLAQKAIVLAGTLAAIRLFRDPLPPLAGASALAALSTAALARVLVERQWGAKAEAPAGERWNRFLAGVFSEFTLWQHAAGVLLNWIQTMDVFFLGLFRVPAREVGLYGSVLKVVNFSLLLPHALANLFSIWVGRRGDSSDGRKRERGVAARSSLLLAGVGLLQAAILILLGETIYGLLSHGRWTEEEIARMVRWTVWIASGTAVLGTGFVAMNWAMLRDRMRMVFLRVSLPAAVLAFLIYGAMVRGLGLDGAARANLPVAAIFAGLAILHARRSL
jgi:hypothetical protein